VGGSTHTPPYALLLTACLGGKSEGGFSLPYGQSIHSSYQKEMLKWMLVPAGSVVQGRCASGLQASLPGAASIVCIWYATSAASRENSRLTPGVS
jgi:hypothetical protein